MEFSSKQHRMGKNIAEAVYNNENADAAGAVDRKGSLFSYYGEFPQALYHNLLKVLLLLLLILMRH